MMREESDALSSLQPPALAKSIESPSRSSPLERSWLLMYDDAVRRLSVSIMAADAVVPEIIVNV
jgi:hypothetical protein